MTNTDNAHALIIGVGGDDIPQSVTDAKDIHDVLVNPELSGYKLENTKLLLKEDATRENILQELDNLIKVAGEDSSVLIFYSGHGGWYEKWDQFYLVPHGFDKDNFKETWVMAEELRHKLSTLNTNKLIFLLDSCFAAGITRGGRDINEIGEDAPAVPEPIKELRNADKFLKAIEAKEGMSIVSSCRESQKSWILRGDKNSLFTKCLLEVLQGENRDTFDDNVVRISEVVQYLFSEVPKRKSIQSPYANLVLYEDFILTKLPEKLKEKIEEPPLDNRLAFLIEADIEDTMASIMRKREKKNFLSERRDIASDASMLFTLEKQIFELDVQISNETKKIRNLQKSLNQ